MTTFNHDLEVPKSKANKFNFRVLLNFVHPENVEEIESFLTVYPKWTQHLMNKLCFAEIFSFLQELETAENVVVKQPADPAEVFDFELNFDEGSEEDLRRLREFFATLELDLLPQFNDFMEHFADWNETNYKSIQSLYYDFLRSGPVGEAVDLLQAAFNIKYTHQNCNRLLLRKAEHQFLILYFIFSSTLQQ